MQEAARQARNAERLAELHPAMRARVRSTLALLENAGFRPRIQDAWRSPADQLVAFNSGHSKVKFGFHNFTDRDGTPSALAADVLDDDHPLALPRPYLLQLAAAAERCNLTSGFRWGLPSKLHAAIDDAIARQDWQAAVRLGWDPTHLEPADITLAQAKEGKRPQ